MTDLELFKPEHFQSITWADAVEYPRGGIAMAKIANRIFREYVASCPVVYATMRNSVGETIWSSEQTEDEKLKDTHSARIFDIRELKPKDTAEIKARELMTLACRVFDLAPSAKLEQIFIEHARKLLDGGSGR